MPIATSGILTIQDLVTEFGGTAPHSLSQFYRGGALVENIPANSAIPTGGAISLSQFYGGRRPSFDTGVFTITTGQSGTASNIVGYGRPGGKLPMGSASVDPVITSPAITFIRDLKTRNLTGDGTVNFVDVSVSPGGGNTALTAILRITGLADITLPRGTSADFTQNQFSIQVPTTSYAYFVTATTYTCRVFFY